MLLESFIRALPKVELHIHLEGAIQPETLLILAQRNNITLPAMTVAGLRDWYTYSDFAHFVKVYLGISACIQSVEDIEFVAREFLVGQAKQHIRYSEVTYTAFTHYYFKKIPFKDQLAALNRARAWAKANLNTTMGIIIDIPRLVSAEEGLMIAEWAIGGMGNGVIALGLGGSEADNPPEKFQEAFDRAYAAGLPAVPHAGEMAGAASIWGALHALHAKRIGHGVRCIEDPALVEELRVRQVVLEVCPSSNVCLAVVPTLAEHPLPRLLAAGLYITINSDDPPLFNTTLTDEYCRIAHTFGFGREHIGQFARNALRASFLPEQERNTLEQELDHYLCT